MKTNTLKSLALIFFILSSYYHIVAQSKEEQEIRKLESIETAAILKGDTATLLSTWSPELIVNNPANIVVTRPQIVVLIKAGKIDYASFDRVIERISIIDRTAIVMGREEIKPEGVTDHSGKIVIRRFTNIWVKDKRETWKLVARQATISSIQ